MPTLLSERTAPLNDHHPQCAADTAVADQHGLVTVVALILVVVLAKSHALASQTVLLLVALDYYTRNCLPSQR